MRSPGIRRIDRLAQKDHQVPCSSPAKTDLAMKRNPLCTIVVFFTFALYGCISMNPTNLVNELGGMDKIQSLSSSFLQNVSGDSRVSNMLGGQDTSSLTGKLSNQICSMMGGDCKPALSNDQIDAASKKLSPETSSALGDNFSKALDSVTSSSTVKETINKTVGSKIGGILGGLLQK
jgi:hypothetical protein